MVQFEETFMHFLMQHQERHERTYHFRNATSVPIIF